MYLSFYTHILVENSGQSYILKIVPLFKTTYFFIPDGVYFLISILFYCCR
jgi:hypothetical protein